MMANTGNSFAKLLTSSVVVALFCISMNGCAGPRYEANRSMLLENSSKPATFTNSADSVKPREDMPEKQSQPKETANKNLAKISTKFGDIVVELNEDAAPLTVGNFKKLTQEGYYNGTTFHRVIPNFMIQGGDPLSKDAGQRARHGTGGPNYTIPAEIKLKHLRGSLATARLGDAVNPKRESSGSQFFICAVDCPFLDGQYTVFGQVVSGIEVVDKIVSQKRDSRDNPLEPISMTVTLVNP